MMFFLHNTRGLTSYMVTNKIKSFILLLSFLCIAFLNAQENDYSENHKFSNITRGPGPCGCHCTPDCHCGCDMGNPCLCKPDSGCCTECKEGKPCTCNSDWECKCGCEKGEPCTCNPGCSAYHDYDGDDVYLARLYGLKGVWLPEDCPLFRPFVADPRQVCLSAGWRFNDQALVKNVIDVSYGDNLPIYRWLNIGIGPFCGELQFEVEGALWAVFDPLHDSSPLVNADYYIGFPLTYAFDNWAFRLRGFHISSHLGDEFLLDHPGFPRRNPSAEYLDFFVSNQFTEEIRLYAGVGGVLAEDESFTIGRFYTEAGLELRLQRWGFIDYYQQLYGRPFYGMHFRWNKEIKHHLDMTYVLGYEFGKMTGLCHRLRIFAEYHDGYSVEGQFQHIATNYLSFRLTYGY
jgi:Protein of unknown function (DUF1207)